MPAVRKSGKVFRPLRRLHAATQLKLSQKHRESMPACLRTVSRLAGNHEGASNTKREKRSVLSGLGPGSYVMTSQGELPVEWLAVGDQLVTRDHGLQPLRHIERTRGTEDYPLPDPLVLPLPEESISRQSDPLYMAPLQMVMMQHPLIEIHFAVQEAVCPIIALSRRKISRYVSARPLVYHTLVLPMHALIMVNGLWIESCGYVQSQRIRIPASTKTDILDPTHKAPRRVLTAWEAKLMRRLIPQNLNIRDIICAA